MGEREAWQATPSVESHFPYDAWHRTWKFRPSLDGRLRRALSARGRPGESERVPELVRDARARLLSELAPRVMANRLWRRQMLVARARVACRRVLLARLPVG